MKLGLIARCDRGGLAAQTFELWRHLHPARTLVLDVTGTERGPSHPERFVQEHDHLVRVVAGRGRVVELTGMHVDWLLAGVDVVLTAETPYNSKLISRARRRGIPVVIQANPELWFPAHYTDAHVLLPTRWEQDRFDDWPDVTAGLPMPVARDVLPRRTVRSVETFVHQWAPAFHDRNGTDLVLKACRHVESRVDLIVRAPKGAVTVPDKIGNVRVTLDTRDAPHYWQGWPDDADALILPRRFGGLSLTMNEAASLGLPIVTLDLPPQNGWVHPAGLVPARNPRQVRMGGAGEFSVWDASARLLAAAMDRLHTDAHLARAASDASDAYAESISWDRWRDDYVAWLSWVASSRSSSRSTSRPRTRRG